MPFAVVRRVRRVASLAGWTVVDQVLSALSNVLLSVLVARNVDADGFGAFSSAFLIFSLVLGVTRAAVGQPLQISFASAEPRRFRAAVRSALGAALAIGTGTGLAAVVAGLAVSGSTGSALIALGVCLPGLVLQDTSRMAFFSAGRPRSAAAIDATWALLLFPGLLALQSSESIHIWVPVVLWGVSAALAGVVGAVLLHALPRLRGGVPWAWRQRPLSGYLIAEYILNQGIAQVGILFVAVAGSEAGVGALRAGQVLLGPLNVLGAAAFMFAVPEIARRTSMSPRSRGLFALSVSGAISVATAVYAAAILLLPESVGRELFGDTWTGARSVLVPLCLMSLSAALATGPAATLYGVGLARITFRINLIKAPLLVALLVLGIALYGAVGAAWAIALTETVLLPIWFLRLRSALRSDLHVRDKSDHSGPEAPPEPPEPPADSPAPPPPAEAPMTDAPVSFAVPHLDNGKDPR